MSQGKSTYGRHQQGLDILSLAFVFLTQVREKMLIAGKKYERSKLAHEIKYLNMWAQQITHGAK